MTASSAAGAGSALRPAPPVRCTETVTCVRPSANRIAAKCVRDIMSPGAFLRRATMGELIVLDDYRRTCHNCLWHDDAHGACKRPGGWEWDKHYTSCITFAWRCGRPGVQNETT